MDGHWFISALLYALIGLETLISKAMFPYALSLPSSSLSSSLLEPQSPATSIVYNQHQLEKTTNSGNNSRSHNNYNIGSNANSNSTTLKLKPMCKISEWKCPNGTCIPLSKYCNGIPDCMDKSDEPNECSGKLKLSQRSRLLYLF